MPEALEVSDSLDYVASEALGEYGPMGAPQEESAVRASQAPAEDRPLEVSP